MHPQLQNLRIDLDWDDPAYGPILKRLSHNERVTHIEVDTGEDEDTEEETDNDDQGEVETEDDDGDNDERDENENPAGV